MSDTGVTNINDLPSNENVKISIESKDTSSVSMNDIFKEIQETGESGNIPSRDIPINTNSVAIDRKSIPDYIPEHEYYINDAEIENKASIVESKRKSDNKKASIEVFYEELQIPILLGVIYFLFQLPVFNHTISKYLSFTFDLDGGINLSGIVLKSVLYALVYYTLSKVLHNMSD
jgi:hypothetical protein|tara:strand:+ start:1136 stop:1660 length:525 start_codon:yes stop_codon:yes gene_type:complete